MLNIKEATALLKLEGITDSEQTVIRWILEGKIKAKRANNFNIDYSIQPKDLTTFILEKQIEKKCKQFGVDYEYWEKTFQENQKLKEENEELKSMVRIERSKVRGLKKMLQAEYTLTDYPPLTYTSLLGLETDAEDEVVKKEFKKLLKVLHPDRGGDERLFRVFYEHYTKAK